MFKSKRVEWFYCGLELYSVLGNGIGMQGGVGKGGRDSMEWELAVEVKGNEFVEWVGT